MTTGVIVSQLETLNGSAPAPEELPKGDIAQRIAVLNGLMPKEDLKPSNGEICKQLDIYIENGGGGQPTGTISITENGTVDVTDYASASVNVPDDGGLSGITSGIKLISPKQFTSADLRSLKTGSFTSMNQMFASCSGFTSLNLSGWDTSKVTDMYQMFYYCNNMVSLNLSGWDTSKVTDMRSMFLSCASLTSIDLSGFDTSSVTLMTSMFSGCSNLASVNLSGLDLAPDVSSMFSNCKSLTSLDLSGLDFGTVTNASNLFDGCSGLTSLDMSSFCPASTCKNLSGLFKNCSNLTSLDLRALSTPATTSIGSMFNGCSKLKSIYLPKIDTTNVTSASDVIKNCTALEALIWATDMPTVQGIKSTANTFGFNTASNCILYVPDALVTDYQNDSYLSSIASRIKGVSELPQVYKDLYDIS